METVRIPQFNETTTRRLLANRLEGFLIWQMLLSHHFMDVISKKLDEIPKEDLDKVVEFAKNGGFKEV